MAKKPKTVFLLDIQLGIESYIARIIKVMFRSKPKIFNEKTIYKVMLLKQLTANGINPFQ
ncbi:hypothetical protein [Spiroplasma endosymbiont of Polydrusus pterygomalis]|uniref:hypothetical protein n=1 Tax=Spiroplasma endosymbiont of Polydrusus pterygomalis TaxID=3139327 RepID=UPI003CCAB04A